MHAKDRIHRKLFKQAILNHLARTATAFFGRLKDQIDSAVKVAVFGKVLGRCQQHGGVAIVSACMHLASVRAGVVKRVEFLHGQRIHVGTKSDGAFAGAIFDNAHHTGGTHAPVNGNTPFGQPSGHHIGCTLLFKTQLRVSVDITPDFGNACGLGNDGINGFHGISSRSTAHKPRTRHASYARQCTHASRKTPFQSLA